MDGGPRCEFEAVGQGVGQCRAEEVVIDIAWSAELSGMVARGAGGGRRCPFQAVFGKLLSCDFPYNQSLVEAAADQHFSFVAALVGQLACTETSHFCAMIVAFQLAHYFSCLGVNSADNSIVTTDP